VPDIDTHIKRLKSPRKNVREKAVFYLCRKIIEKKCENPDILKEIIDGIKSIYPILEIESRSIALDVLSRYIKNNELHELVRSDLGYAYLKFRSAHSYLFNILFFISRIEFQNDQLVGNYFDLEKQFKFAFELLKAVNSDALN